MQISRERQGELIIFVCAILWALFYVSTVRAYDFLEPIFFGSLASAVAAIFFAIVLTLRKAWGELIAGTAMKEILAASFIIAVLFFGLQFIGLKYTSVGNVAVIELMEVFFSFIIVSLIMKHEPFVRDHAMGAMFMVLGAIIILLPNASSFQLGDFIILGAAAIPPIGNIYQQKARAKVQGCTLLFVRSCIAAIFFFFLSYFIESRPTVDAVYSAIPFIIISGVIALGLKKLLWIEAIHRLPISKSVTLLLTATPFFTFFLAFFFLGEVPNIWQIGGLIPILFGVRLLLR